MIRLRTALALLACVMLPLAAADYYVSPGGDNQNPGTAELPWQTIERVNAQTLSPGDSVFFEGGQTFTGNLVLAQQGTADHHILVGSYGTGRATIAAGDGTAVEAINTGGITVRDLNLEGNGTATNTGFGIYFCSEKTNGERHPSLTFDACSISGFKNALQVGSADYSYPGFDGVNITNIEAYNNGAGIFTWDWAKEHDTIYGHRNVLIRDCYVHNNAGSGIIVAGTDGGLVEYCRAADNGPKSGSVAIWTYSAKNVTIQYCIATGQTTPSADGGGFDIDGGSENVTIQYCYSANNYGPGYVHFDYPQARPTRNNVIRYNISENDGIKLNETESGLLICSWGSGLDNCHSYNNTVYISAKASGSFPNAGLFTKLIADSSETWGVANPRISNCSMRNNVVYVVGSNQRLVDHRGGPNAKVLFQGNRYYALSSNSQVWRDNSTNYTSLASWRSSRSQERLNGADVGSFGDPRLSNAGSAGTLTDPRQLHLLSAYHLGDDSPCVDSGLDLATLFSWSLGSHDFFGNSIPSGAGYSVGAHDRALANYTVTYHANGASSGSAPAEQSKIYGVSLTLATNSGNLARSGFTFAGWNTNADGSGTHYAGGASYTDNAVLNLYAEWTAKPGTLQLAASQYTVQENAGSIALTINRSNGSGGMVSVDYTLSAGSASAGVDFTSSTGTVQCAAGETSATITIPIIDDSDEGDDEANETFTVTLSNPTGGATLGSTTSATVRIIDDDQLAGSLVSNGGFESSALSGWDNWGGTVVTNNASAARGGSQRAVISGAGGFGQNIFSGLSAGQTYVVRFWYRLTGTGSEWTGFGVTAENSSGKQVDEYLLLTNAAATGSTWTQATFTYTLPAASTASWLWVWKNDGGRTLELDDISVVPIQPGVLTIAASSATLAEDGGSTTVTVTRSGGSDGSISVNYAPTGGSATAGTDYQGGSGTLTFAQGVTAQSFTITSHNDTDTNDDEPNESFTLALSSPSGGATLGSVNATTLRIIDDDQLAGTKVNNGGFESGSLTSWDNWGGTTISNSDLQARGGSKRATIGPSAGGFGQNIFSQLSAGQTYEVTFWYRLTGSGSEWTGFGVTAENSSGKQVDEYLLLNSAASTGATWTRATFTFTLPAASTASWLWLWKNTGTRTLEIDDVSVIVVPSNGG